ncbi:hypothetical protein ACNOYE_14425 [Nannocystaceae bacterium ST9]
MNYSLRACSFLAPLALVPLALLACNQPPPPGSDDEAGSETTAGDTTAGDTTTSADDTTTSADTTGDTASDTTDTGMPEQSLYPLVDGAQWSYVVTNTGGQVLGMDVTSLSASTWNGMQAFDLVDEPDAQGDWSVSTLIQSGDEIMRVHREEMGQGGTTAILDYDPGFVRASDAWTAVGVMEEFLYDRIAYDGNGQNPMVEARGHTFEVLAVGEQVSVPAGTFDCVKVERVRTVGTEAGALAWFWYAPGVGKVREERPVEMEIEELVSVSIPGGVDLP